MEHLTDFFIPFFYNTVCEGLLILKYSIGDHGKKDG